MLYRIAFCLYLFFDGLYLFYWLQIKKLIIFAKICLILQVSYHKILNSGPKGTKIDQLDQMARK